MDRTLRFGPIGLRWRCDDDDPRWGQFLLGYGPWLDPDAPGDLDVEAEIAAGGRGPGPLPASFIRTRTVRGREFDLDGLVRGEVRGRTVRCLIDPILLAGNGLRVLEQFFYLLFHTAGLERGAPGSGSPFLLHSSAVAHRGRVLLFCGPSGSGKSTAAALCPTGRLLTDEAAVLAPDGDGFRVAGSPVNPFCPGREPGEGSLGTVNLLEQAGEHAVLPAARLEAVPRLAAEVIAPLGLLETDLGLGLARALDCALALHATGRVRRLRFRADPGFWDLVAAPPAGADRKGRP